MNVLQHWIVALGIVCSVLAGCGSELASVEPSEPTDIGKLTGLSGVERAIHFRSYVYLAPQATDGEIEQAIARQVKTAIGALRASRVSLSDREAHANLTERKWTREILTAVASTSPDAERSEVLKVTYDYDDRAVVTTALDARSSLDLVLLAHDYINRADTLKAKCSDDAAAANDSLWYHFEPSRQSCRTWIRDEANGVSAEAKALAGSGAIGPRERNRVFMPVVAKLDAPNRPERDFYPEYDRLFGVDDDRALLVVYAFLGVDGYAPADAYNPDDILAKEAMRFYRTVLREQPNFRPVHTAPFAYLLDLTVDGKKLDGVTFERMLTWIIDGTDLPPEVAADAHKTLALRQQALARFAERWIYWDLPLEVKTTDGRTKNITLQLRSYYGQEDGTPEARARARNRYLEAFWHADVFVYNGHSHFGHGPLEPVLFSAANFPARYQLMLFNSCISFNYYHQDFLDMKTGGTQNLETVVNGLPSYVNQGGVASARFVTGLVDGRQQSYADLLRYMTVDLGWQSAYEPMRVVDGELDNVYRPEVRPLTVRVLPPVY